MNLMPKKFNNLDEVDKFPEKYNLPKWIQIKQKI